MRIVSENGLPVIVHKFNETEIKVSFSGQKPERDIKEEISNIFTAQQRSKADVLTNIQICKA